ncbi:NHLP bacteriocin export ABC transporter permease/ATPase subunit [Puniceibacterium sediminis]|uniref:NHLM bacteriocin system ABC transporter, ATP-binding protein n=1 Tax=Puniceibacterium sediminis TaxID=1608407 RepID=A0A238ZKF8_9RHOB|nr:NHLP bacteriocin export ABC transporter permease/ATPase subunit [Puniceibacterium sediminis]SNR83163.1 NHLM bacteriocin system ABC transporter, ATP-binding protein [Puniceibacterium sediminis]
MAVRPFIAVSNRDGWPESPAGPLVSCNASAPIFADPGDRAWVVEKGKVYLFALIIAPDGQESARLEVFEIDTGDLIIGMPDILDPDKGRSDQVRLLMVGSLSCQLRQVARDTLIESEQAAAIMAWAERLVGFLGRQENDNPASAALAKIRDGDVATGLATLSEQVMTHASHMIGEREDAARDRMARRGALEISVQDADLQRANAILSNRDAHADQINSRTTDPIARCFGMVAVALGAGEVSLSHPSLKGGFDSRLRALATINAIRLRRVLLRDDWHQADNGPLIAFQGDPRYPVALLLQKTGAYSIYDGSTGDVRRLSPAEAQTLEGEAFALYPTAPSAPQNLGTLLRNALGRNLREFSLVILMGVLVGLLALATPLITGYLVRDVIPRAEVSRLAEAALGLFMIALGAAAFRLVQAINVLRLESRIDHFLQAAVFDRLIMLPAGFFGGYSGGDLADRALAIQKVRTLLSGNMIQALLLGIFSTTSFILLFFINWRLALIATAFVVFLSCMIAGLTVMQRRAQADIVRNQGALDGLTVQLVSSVGKLRTAAAERRAFSRWLVRLLDQKERERHAQKWANWTETLSAVIPVLSSIVVFVSAAMILKSMAQTAALEALVSSDPGAQSPGTLSTADFISFNAAFGQFLAAFIGIALALSNLTEVAPLLNRIKPILEAVPERIGGFTDPGKLSGDVDFRNVSFSYLENGPVIIDRLDLSIRAGEFVAIVGASGSGKSTLVRLLIGFETPGSGEILFDSKALSDLDLGAVRAQIGVVLQAGRINPGSIASNIIGATGAGVEDAWDAAELAGLDKEIKAMPMGMHTVLVDGAQTLSGGQRQRLMIARALLQKPGIVILDEATSALDNRTQAIVTENLKHLNATRIVIAHRLSTIAKADRIVVMDRGQVVQSGTYDDLMATDGLFRDLATRQLV